MAAGIGVGLDDGNLCPQDLARDERWAARGPAGPISTDVDQPPAPREWLGTVAAATSERDALSQLRWNSHYMITEYDRPGLVPAGC